VNEEADEVLESLKHAVIEGGGLTDEGLHIFLEDGRVVVFYGQFILGVVRPETKTLQ
jgi:hypothetical protein